MRLAATAILGALLAGPVSAQPAPLDLPLPSPGEPYRLAIPQGFATVSVEAHAVLCEPHDQPWVRQVLQELPPPQPPSTMPADLLQRVEALRPEIVQELVAALALPDGALLDPVFEQHLLPPLRALRELRPPLLFLVTTHARLRELVRAGWDNPNLRYNRLADDVAFDPVMHIHPDGRMDDLVWPVLIDPNQPAEENRQLLATIVPQVQANVLRAIALRAQAEVQGAFTDGIRDAVFEPLQLQPDQQWLAAGISGVLAARCTAYVADTSFEQVLRGLTQEPPGSPLSASAVDLLNPPDPAALRPEYIEPYRLAMGRKALLAAHLLLEEAGYDAAGKILAHIRQANPPDGRALVEQIHQLTGIDLTPHLTP